ncbi:MAG TPA: ATP-binding protein [Chryseolinea sp.]|nr:ATP-binding protein [Chryseolinea sp.]
MKLYLSQKILLGFAISMLAIVSLGIGSFIYIRKVVELSREISHTQHILARIELVGTRVSRLENATLRYNIGKGQTGLKGLASMQVQLAKDVHDLDAESTLPGLNLDSIQSLQQNIQQRLDVYDLIAGAINAERSWDIARMEQLAGTTDKLLTGLRAKIEAFRKFQQAKATSQFYQFIFTFAALLIGGLLMLAILIYMLNDTLKSRSNAETRLVSASQDIQDLYENAPCGYFSVTKDGVISDVNQTLLKWLGYAKQQVVNNLSVDQILPGGTALFQNSIMDQMIKGEITDLELEMIQARQSKVPVIVSSRITTDKSGNYSYARCSVVDNTARKRAEQESMRLNKELEAFAYSVSHDLRAPLRSINGYAQILKEDFEEKLGTDGTQLIEIITKAASGMDQLINDLLQFSRIGREGINKVRTKMIDLVTPILDELVNAEKGRKINITLVMNGINPVDVNMFRQVWINLISNALKYSTNKSETTIELGSQESEDETIYFIKDNGAGFDMAYAHKLFIAFQRLHKSKEFQGTGVGLALVKRIIEKHGGAIWAEAKVGEGATFYFKLPKG